MSRTHHQSDAGDDPEQRYRTYILDVRIVEVSPTDGETSYRFEAPHHRDIEFAEPESA